MRTHRIIMLSLLMGLVRVPGARAFQPLDDPIPAPIPQGRIRVKLEPVATGLVAPIYMTSATSPFREGHGHDGRGHDGRGRGKLYVVDQTGRVLVLNRGAIEDTPLLDISELLSHLSPAFPGAPQGINPGYDERGLLGLAFHPDFSRPGEPASAPCTRCTTSPSPPRRTSPSHRSRPARPRTARKSSPNGRRTATG